MIQPNPNVAAMNPYALPDISAADGLQPIVLAQNEHAWPPSEKVQAAVAAAIGKGQLYPDSDCSELHHAIAAVHKLNADNIVCGTGSMELMSSLMLAYLSVGDRLLMSEYGYLFMRTLAKLVAARAAMEDQETVREASRLIAQQREFLSTAISALGLTVVPSQTNFILVDFVTAEDAVSAFEFLRQHGLVVRPMGGYGLPACLRITIGTGEQMHMTARTLTEWRQTRA